MLYVSCLVILVYLLLLHFHILLYLSDWREGARDLGVSNTAGRYRPYRLLGNRIKQSKNRIQKIKGLSKLNRRARILFSSSALPAETWGHQASGLSPTTVRTIENEAISCTGIGNGRCHFTALVGFYGIFSTPYARILRELFEAWFRLLKSNILDSLPLKDLRVAWAKAKKAIVQPNTLNFNIVRGVMSNVIYTLASLSWLPISIDVWQDSEENIWKLDLL